MLISINSLAYLIKNFNFISILFYKSLKTNFSNLKYLKKINLNNYFVIKNKALSNLFFFFKTFIKANNFFFVKCVKLVLHNYFYKFISVVYYLVFNNYSFYVLSENKSYNLFWLFDIEYLKKNLTKANFMRFLINFLKKNKVKLVVFTDLTFINYLNFFKKLNLITAGSLSTARKLNSYNYPLFFQNNNAYSSFFLYNVMHDVYVAAQKNKYNLILNKFFKNYYSLNRLLFLI